MNLDEKIARSISEEMDKYVELFQSSDDASDILGLLHRLLDQIPLLEDIKTEVKQLQNQERIQPEEQQEPENDPSNDPSPSDPELPDLRQKLRELGQGLDKTKREWDLMKKLLPSPDDKIPDWMKDLPWYDVVNSAFKIYYMYKLWKESNGKLDEIRDKLRSGDSTFQEFWKESEDEAFKTLDEMLDILNSDMEDLLSQKVPGLFQIGSNIDDKITICCQNQTSGFNNLEDAVDDVKSTVDSTADAVESLSGEAGQLLNLPSYIQNQSNILRGLL